VFTGEKIYTLRID